MAKAKVTVASVLGRNVGDRRRARGWSQAELAERLDVSVDFVSLLERGERMPSLPTLLSLADIFGATVDSIIGRNPASDWSERAIALLSPLSDEQRRVALAMLDGLSGLTPTPKARKR